MIDFTKLLIAQAIVMTIQGVLYFVTQHVAKRPHLVRTGADGRIPYVPEFIFIYLSWFVLILTMPFLLALFSPYGCALYLGGFVIMQLICFTVYFVYPTVVERPAPPQAHTPAAFLVRSTYSIDAKSTNCLPSGHCSVSFLCFIAAWCSPELPLVLKLLFTVWGLAIACSTLLVKQHSTIDVVWAVPTALASWALSAWFAADLVLPIISV